MEVDEEQKVEVRFKTDLIQYRVTDKPFSVPVSLNRLGLSQTINFLLGNNKPVPFDFLIDGAFLRTTLEIFLEKNNKNREEIITIEYVLALNPPQPEEAPTHSDWIATFDNHLLALQAHVKSQIPSDTVVIPYGAYDNKINVYYRSGKDRKQTDKNDAPWVIGEHSQSVLGLSSALNQDGTVTFVSASQDQTVKAWKVNFKTQKSNCILTGEGHDGAVECVEVSPNNELFASGSWDFAIKIWSLSENEEENPSVPAPEYKQSGTKRSKLDTAPKSTMRTIRPQATFLGHNQCVSALGWTSQDQIVSGSWDHSIRFWDVESGVNTSQMNGSKVVLSLSYNQSNKLIATGHSDRSLRVWDARSANPEVAAAGEADSGAVSTAFTSHTGWVSCVSWHPTNPFLLVSGSYDKSIKLWDIRSKTPLHTMSDQHKEKVLCVRWTDKSSFVSGGADENLRFYDFEPNSHMLS